MTRPGRFPQELRERAIRLVFEHQGEHPSQDHAWRCGPPMTRVTLFGAAMSGRGSEQVSETFRSIQQANAPAVVATEGVHSET